MSEGFRESHDEKRLAPWMEKFYSSSDVFPHEVLFLAWICSNGEGLPDFSGSDEAFECAFDPTAFLSLADTLQKWPLGGTMKPQTTRGRPKASELTSGKPVSAFSETSSLPVASDSDQRCSKEEHELRSTDRMGHLIQGQPPRPSSPSRASCQRCTPLHGDLETRNAFSWLHGDMDAIGWWSASYVSFFETLRRTSWEQYLQKRANVESAHRQLVSESAERLLTAVEEVFSSRGTQGDEIDARLVQEVAL
uniref:Uncharacterized protein n=1 Tax=Chromera velia CCMP2878 TaxID=1169474 RepID=A0A0G4FCS7_9ALVE|eukprot:Cvel_16396.t1-p1 / transcript=Cvel_16396.t1 / gene=Cvel_16396 / organism=Chromera_velia_CCMP2878 / gene_product=hypothetical protein / transcript_product=hypothetical protein / location=Cvel_scaffold1262:14749-16116(-) / protein_length=249 / sequence_SO=supercontig / SO=protein_coding / is_pseudo=false